MRHYYNIGIFLGVTLGVIWIVPETVYSYGTSISAPTSISTPTPPKTTSTTTTTTTPTKAVTKSVLPPAPQPSTPTYKNLENYYHQPEEIPPSPGAYDSQEILALIEDQLSAIQKNDFPKAYYNFTSTQFRQATSLEDFRYFVDSFPVFAKNKNALFGSLEFKDGIMSLQGILTALSGETLRVEYDFVKEGPMWKIIGIRLVRPELLQEFNNQR